MSDRLRYTDGLHLLALSSFGLAQPLYNILSQSPEFFVAHRVGPISLVAIVITVSFGIPLALYLIEMTAGILSARLRSLLHLLFVTLLATLIAVVFLNRVGLPSAMVVGMGAVAGLAFFVSYRKFGSLRTFLTMGSLAAMVFPFSFLFLSPVSKLMFPEATAQEQQGIRSAEIPVVLVVFDEFNLPALLAGEDEIDQERFPNFAELSRTAWWFPRATAAYPQTLKAIPAILTGRSPSEMSGPPMLASHPNNLFTWLGGAYDLNVWETITSLCPVEYCRSSSQEAVNYKLLVSDISVILMHAIVPRPYAERFLPPLDTGWKGFTGQMAPKPNRQFLKRFGERIKANRGDEVRNFIARIEGGPGTLDFLHVLLPHASYEFLPDGTRYQADDIDGILPDKTWSKNDYLIKLAYQRQLLQTGFVDTLIGELISKLKASGKYDDALIIITADHGVAFDEGVQKRGLSLENGSELLQVPMFVKEPGQKKGRISLRPVSSLDILPTIADVLGETIPWPTAGASMVASEFPSRETLEIDVGKKHGGVLKFNLDSFSSEPRRLWKAKAFGIKTSLSSFMVSSPYSDLIGRDVDAVPIKSHPEISWSSEDAAYFADVDPSSGWIPAKLDGNIIGLANDKPAWLVIGLNRKIAAIVPTFGKEGDRRHFSAVLPQRLFQPGSNNLEVFLLESRGDEVVLNSLEGEAADRLVLRDGRLEGDEVTYLLLKDAAHGQVYRVIKEDHEIRFVGWAADVANKQAVKQVAMFIDGEFWAAAATDEVRPNVAKNLGKPHLKPGFSIRVPLSRLDAHPTDIQFFAIAQNGKASELSWGEEARAYLGVD